MFVASFAEIISIGAVVPFIGVITNPDLLFEHPLIIPLIDILDLRSTDELILPITILFILTAAVAGTIRLILLYATTRLSYGAGHDLSIKVYRQTLYQSYPVHVARNSSEVINSIITKTSTVISGVLTPAITLISSSIIMFGILGVLCFIDMVVALTAFAGFGTLYFIIIFYTKSKIRKNSEVIATHSDRTVKALQEGLMGIRDVLIYGSQEFYSEIYRKADFPLRRSAGNNLFISGSPRFTMEAIGMILIAVIAFFMVEQQSGVAQALPVLGALALGAQRLLPIMQQAYGSYSAIKGSKASLNDVVKLLDQPTPEYVNNPSVTPILFNKEITLKNIGFRYGSDEPWILEGADLLIQKGARVGVFGATGSGKSTLFDIIMGLNFPDKGTMEIDGEIVNERNIRAWQAHIAHVPQDIYLSDNTIAENIAFGTTKTDIDLNRVKVAADRAQISNLIDNWEMKYETCVGEHGIRLSGGQRQRIGIARALYKDANVLVFDEATSALDSKTETSVVEAIESLGKDLTVLIIAHRLSTLKNCDQIIEVSDRKIKETSYEKAIIEN
jgi:ATP-binding cassette subfamily B protein